MGYAPQPRVEVHRTTQGFVANLTWLQQRPLLTLVEVAWRWCFGIPALLLIYRAGSRALDSVPWQATGIANLSVNQLLTDPMAGSTTVANFATIVTPPLYHALAWLAPLLLLAWAVVSGLGRTVMMRRMDSTLHAKLATLMLLQLMRLLPLVAAFAAW